MSLNPQRSAVNDSEGVLRTKRSWEDLDDESEEEEEEEEEECVDYFAEKAGENDMTDLEASSSLAVSGEAGEAAAAVASEAAAYWNGIRK